MLKAEHLPISTVAAIIGLTGCTGNSVSTANNPVAVSAGSNGPSTTALSAGTDTTPSSCTIDTDQMRIAMLTAINQSRAHARDCGVNHYAASAALVWDSRLADAATAHSIDMADNDFFSHTGSNGQSVADRAELAAFDWRAIGENIASGQQSVGEVHNNWLQSPGHCSNIMSEQYTAVGASCVRREDSRYGTYWTVVFGR